MRAGFKNSQRYGGIAMDAGFSEAILELAKAINRLAATQEKAKVKGAVTYSIASFEDQPDGQTVALRELSRKSREGGEDEAS
jgi:hypothetical protein